MVNVQPKVSIAEVVFSCDYIQRGDMARPFEERPAPPFKEAAAFDHFAPVSGKPVGTVVSSFDYHQLLGRGDAMYVNVGAAKGVKVGDYMRVFRYQGKDGDDRDGGKRVSVQDLRIRERPGTLPMEGFAPRSARRGHCPQRDQERGNRTGYLHHAPGVCG